MPGKSRKKNRGKQSSLHLAMLFSALVIFLILATFVIKLATIVAQSTFNGIDRFNVSVINTNKTHILSFAPGENTIAALTLKGNKDVKNQVGKRLRIPIDGTIETKMPLMLSEDELKTGGMEKTFWHLLTNYPTLRTNLTVIDLARIWFFAKSRPMHEISSRTLAIAETITSEEELVMDRLSSSLFSDKKITEERMSIHIVNGASVPGMANQLARFVANTGGNVVSLSTSDKTIEVSEVIYNNKTSYTAERLARALAMPLRKIEEAENKNQVDTAMFSDIIILLGKDKVSLLVL